MMQTLLGDIRRRLDSSRYVNEAAISHGIVMPILRELGWDSADPDQLVPEYSVPERGCCQSNGDRPARLESLPVQPHF